MDERRQAHLRMLHVGQTFHGRLTLPESFFLLFRAITGDGHPLWADRLAAQAAGVPWPVAPPMVPVALVSGVMARVAETLPPPGGVSYRYDLEMAEWIHPGDTITTRLELVEIDEQRYEAHFRAACENDRGEVVAHGTTVLKVL